MRSLGFVVGLIGIFYIFVAFNMDVSVSTLGTYVPGYGRIGGGDVANIDLMQRRQNHLIVACLITLIGVLLVIFGKKEDERLNETGRRKSITSFDEEFKGEFDLSSDRYRLWLARKYNVERNEIFDCFLIGEETFRSLEDALSFAHSQELDLAIAEADRLAAMAEAADIAEAERVAAAEKEVAYWQEFKPKLIAGVLISIALMVGIYFVARETPEERQARLAFEAAEAEAELEAAEDMIGVNLPEDVESLRSQEGNSSAWCAEEVGPDGKTIEYSFATDTEAATLKNLFVNRYGPGQPAISLLDGPADDWKWEAEGKSILLQHIDYDGGKEKVVCITTTREG